MSIDRDTADHGDPRATSILRAAAELLDEGGYAALSVRAIASRAKISAGLLYYYFEDRHAVFAALMMQRQREMVELLDALPRDEGLTSLLRRLVPTPRPSGSRSAGCRPSGRSSAWRYLPASFGPWTRVWSQFRRWSQVAEALGTTTKTLANWRSRSTGPAYVRVAGRVYYTRTAYEAYWREQMGGAA